MGNMVQEANAKVGKFKLKLSLMLLSSVVLPAESYHCQVFKISHKLKRKHSIRLMNEPMTNPTYRNNLLVAHEVAVLENSAALTQANAVIATEMNGRDLSKLGESLTRSISSVQVRSLLSSVTRLSHSALTCKVS